MLKQFQLQGLYLKAASKTRGNTALLFSKLEGFLASWDELESGKAFTLDNTITDSYLIANIKSIIEKIAQVHPKSQYPDFKNFCDRIAEISAALDTSRAIHLAERSQELELDSTHIFKVVGKGLGTDDENATGILKNLQQNLRDYHQKRDAFLHVLLNPSSNKIQYAQQKNVLLAELFNALSNLKMQIASIKQYTEDKSKQWQAIDDTLRILIGTIYQYNPEYFAKLSQQQRANERLSESITQFLSIKGNREKLAREYLQRTNLDAEKNCLTQNLPVTVEIISRNNNLILQVTEISDNTTGFVCVNISMLADFMYFDLKENSIRINEHMDRLQYFGCRGLFTEFYHDPVRIGGSSASGITQSMIVTTTALLPNQNLFKYFLQAKSKLTPMQYEQQLLLYLEKLLARATLLSRTQYRSFDPKHSNYLVNTAGDLELSDLKGLLLVNLHEKKIHKDRLAGLTTGAYYDSHALYPLLVT